MRVHAKTGADCNTINEVKLCRSHVVLEYNILLRFPRDNNGEDIGTEITFDFTYREMVAPEFRGRICQSSEVINVLIVQ